MNTKPSSLTAWLMASRPRTLPAAAAPVLVGSALAWEAGAFHSLAALACLVGALLLQIGANFANDLYDFHKGADTAERLGPTRVTSAGLLSPGAVRVGMIVVFALATMVGLYLVARGGLPIVLIGVTAIVAAIAYTGGPFPLGYNGLGDLFVFLFFGLIAVAGTYYVQALALAPAALWAGAGVGALATAILVVNNVRDVETDRRAGKRTLAVLFGREAARAEYWLLLALAYGVCLVLAFALGLGAWALLPLLSVPRAVTLARTVQTQTDGPTLNRALAGTAQLVALYSALLAVGVVVG